MLHKGLDDVNLMYKTRKYFEFVTLKRMIKDEWSSLSKEKKKEFSIEILNF